MRCRRLLRSFLFFPLLLLFANTAMGATPVFINEIHYDNTSTDTGEAIEIAGPAGTDLTGWHIVLYNGNGGAVYDTDALSGTIPDAGNGFGVVSLTYAANGIQNGAPDGIALVDDTDTAVQFLSYEGSFTAVGGAADGMTSVDIGVAEDGATPEGDSLQLIGTGSEYEDFAWQSTAANSFGNVNSGQTFGDASSSGGPFTIFHMNDAHSRILPHDFDVPEMDDVPVMEQVGGAAYFTTKMLELKAAEPNSLILDAGDISEGNPLGDLRGNGGIIDFYNLLDTKLKALGGRGIDAVVVGNHDVRSSQMLTNLKPVAAGGLAQFPTISVNVCEAGTTTPVFDPYVIVQVNGTRVGILGYTNDESSYLGDDLEGVIEVVKCTWEGGSGEISIKAWVNTLRTTENCDVVILLSHMGQSRVTSGDDALIADSGGVEPPEVVVSGHWHTWTERVWQPSNMNGKTLVAEAASYLQYIGELDLDNVGDYVDAQKHVIRNTQITPDTQVNALIATLTSEYNATSPPHALDEVIGYSAIDLTLDKDKWWTVSEYPWNATNAAGAWICDAMVWKAGQLGYPVELALQSGGGIRRDIAAGEITYVEIYEAYPWSDDNMVRVEMTGQEIWNWIQTDYVGTSISGGWLVTAHDGRITGITYQGNSIDLSGTYNVAISEYMHAHPEISLSDTSPEDVGYSIREGVVDYTGQYSTPSNPMYPSGITPRYDLNTEFAGGFKAVVTMIADDESQPYFEEAFIRFVEAMPETLTRREGYGLADLVNTDGSINLENRFSEIMLYRSHLGFPNGGLQPGDIIEVWGEGSSFDGTPEFIDQEGIYDKNTEFMFHGHDEELARPEYHPTIASFWDEEHENHYVKFYATKAGTSLVYDSSGQSITVYQPGGYYTMSLPGNAGDILQLTGVNTQESYGADRRFRCHTAVVASTVPVTGYPATSTVGAIDPYAQSGTSITLSATASDVSGTGTGATLMPTDDAQVVEGYPTANYGSSASLYVQSASGGYLDERAWVKFDLGGVVPTGATITSAKLKLYCWKAGSEDMDAAVYSISDDSWGESSITWDLQPTLGSTLNTVTLAKDQAGVWYEWDVTDFVTAEAAGDAVVSLVVRPVTEGSSTYLTYTFDSKEYSSGSLAPVLEIQWGDGSSDPAPTQVQFFYRYAADGLAWGDWTPIGTDTDSTDGWHQIFTYPHGQGHYAFYSVATDLDGNIENTPVRADVRCLFNNSASVTADTGSATPDGATGISLSPTLSVVVSDADGAVMDVYFYDADGNLIGVQEDVASGTTASVVWEGLASDTTYAWYATVDDGLNTTDSPIWSFTTAAANVASVPAINAWTALTVAILLALSGMLAIRRRPV
ncbi:hypothetical protein JCM12296A_25930 [Desulfosarcina cetonica]